MRADTHNPVRLDPTPLINVHPVHPTNMAVCSYLVIPAEDATDAVALRLSAIPGCEVTRAENRDILLLVTETDSTDEENALRARLEGVDDILAMVFTFGEIDGGGTEEPLVQIGGAA
jgi:nitrate reductase NapAB chaperone NapD